MGGVEQPTVKPETPTPTLDALIVTGGSIEEVVVVVVESMKNRVWVC